MAISGSFNTNAHNGRYLRFVWDVKSQSVVDNKTIISWSLQGAGDAAANWYYANNFEVVISNSTVYSSSGSILLYNGTEVASGTAVILHNPNGTKTFSASVAAQIGTTTCTGSSSWELPAIDRSATVAQSLMSKTETKAVIQWSTGVTIDSLWYSIDNGSTWSSVGVGSSKSGVYTIGGLSPDTTYQVKTRIRRKDTQVISTSGVMNITTYSYPYANSMPNFTIGNMLTIGLYNPMRRTVRVNIIGVDGSQISDDTTSGVSVTGYNGSVVVDRLYASIPSMFEGSYTVKVTYDSHVTTSYGGNYRANADDCAPIASGAQYWDYNQTTINVTGNDQLLVQNKSIPLYYISSIQPQKYASIISCSVQANGDNIPLTLYQSGSNLYAYGGGYTVDSASDVEAAFSIVDSRGITKIVTITLSMLEYHTPTGIITLKRLHNYYTETTLKVDADYSSINGNNTVAIQWMAREADSYQYDLSGNLQDGVAITVQADNDYEWVFVIDVNDRFGSNSRYVLTLPSGVPLIYFDRLKSSVGINCFPAREKTFEVEEYPVYPHNAITIFYNDSSYPSLNAGYNNIFLGGFVGNGDQLIWSGGFVKIKKGINMVKVSACVGLDQVSSTGVRHVRIGKYSESEMEQYPLPSPTTDQTVGFAWSYLMSGYPQPIVIPPIVIYVNENDYIGLFFNSASLNDKLTKDANGFGCRTCLTVEAIG